jgi:hypothetical protein
MNALMEVALLEGKLVMMIPRFRLKPESDRSRIPAGYLMKITMRVFGN